MCSKGIHRIRVSGEQDDPGAGISISRGPAGVVPGISEKRGSAPGFHTGASAHAGAKGKGGGPLLRPWMQVHKGLESLGVCQPGSSGSMGAGNKAAGGTVLYAKTKCRKRYTRTETGGRSGILRQRGQCGKDRKQVWSEPLQPVLLAGETVCRGE